MLLLLSNFHIFYPIKHSLIILYNNLEWLSFYLEMLSIGVI